jgi:hypothetical protein
MHISSFSFAALESEGGPPRPVVEKLPVVNPCRQDDHVREPPQVFECPDDETAVEQAVSLLNGR